MKNKGFTLVELLAAVVIMAILMVIAVPSVIGISNNIKVSMFCTKVNNLENAAELYGKDYIDDLRKNVYMRVSVDSLIEYNLFKKEDSSCVYGNSNNPCVKDPRDNSSMDKKTLTLLLKAERVIAYYDYDSDEDIKACEGKKDSEKRSNYTVTFYDNDATSPGTKQATVLFGEYIPKVTLLPKKEYTVTATDTKTNYKKTFYSKYTFSGYYSTNNASSTKYVNANGTGAKKYDFVYDKVLYAIWTNGNVNLDTLSKTGYNFLGWYNKNGGKESGGGKYYPKENIELHGEWKAKNYKVTLDAQGATDPGNPSVTATFDSVLSPLSKKPSRTGYTFAGYYTEKDGKGTQFYNANGTGTKAWNIDGDKTLYAKWNPQTYIVTLDSKGATYSGTTSVSAVYDSTLPKINIPSKSVRVTYNFNGNGQANKTVSSDCTFKGYFTSVNGGGDQYYYSSGVGSKKWTIAKNYKLHAYWTPNTSIILPTPNGRDGFVFAGWYTSSNTKVGMGGASYNPQVDITLTAQWVPATYKVTLDNQGATSAGSTSVTATYNAVVPNINSPSKNITVTFDYNGSGQKSDTKNSSFPFNGYYTSVNCGGTQFYNSSGAGVRKYTYTSTKTFYACWGNNGAITLPTPNARSGYTFDGWYDASGNKIGNSGAKFTPDANKTLYAHWSKNCKYKKDQEIRYNYTGNVQTFVDDTCGYTLEFKVYGAQGGGDQYCVGGYGGYATGTKKIAKGTTLYIYAGGSGPQWHKGYNGGGLGCYTTDPADKCTYATGGGGASHVATKKQTLDKYSGPNDAKKSVLIVAGGGGGCSDNSYYGGSGGGLTGGDGYDASHEWGEGGSQTTGYAFGQGQPNQLWQKCGGGGGWYGGYASDGEEHGGGGGSGWVGGVSGGKMQNGVNGCGDWERKDCTEHDGYIIIKIKAVN